MNAIVGMTETESAWQIEVDAQAETLEKTIEFFEGMVRELKEGNYKPEEFRGMGGEKCRGHRVVRAPRPKPLTFSELTAIRQIIQPERDAR